MHLNSQDEAAGLHFDLDIPKSQPLYNPIGYYFHNYIDDSQMVFCLKFQFWKSPCIFIISVLDTSSGPPSVICITSSHEN